MFVVELASTVTYLKGRALGLLHAHEQMVHQVGIAPTCSGLQPGANLFQLLVVVVGKGNAPLSHAYQAHALLLS